RLLPRGVAECSTTDRPLGPDARPSTGHSRSGRQLDLSLPENEKIPPTAAPFPFRLRLADGPFLQAPIEPVDPGWSESESIARDHATANRVVCTWRIGARTPGSAPLRSTPAARLPAVPRERLAR